MNREIKFRAWDKSRNEWSQQSFAIDQHGDLHMWREIGNGPSYAYGHSDLHPVICIYTGLKDKNGREIYEGDVVKLTGDVAFNKPEVVAWNSEKSGFTPYCDQILMAADTYSEWSISTSEIIGNIYENPELLKESK